MSSNRGNTLRLTLRTLQNAVDLLILSLAYWAAFLLRFDGHLPHQIFKRVLFTWPYVVSFEFAVLYVYAIHRFAWRFISLKEAKRVFWAVGTVSLALLFFRYVSGAIFPYRAEAQYALVPIGVILANMGLSFFGIVGVRALRRLSAERTSALKLARIPEEMVPTLLIGAGQAGAQVARELEKRPDLGHEPVGFLDDDPAKIGSTVYGIPVLGTINELPIIAARLNVRGVIVTIAELEPRLLRRIVERCEKEHLKAKILPGLYQLIDEQAGLGRLREVSIEDLLGREPVKLDTNLVETFITGKRVLVTGAGGSIGSELCRQVAAFSPNSLTLVERSEFALFTIQQELIRSFPELKIVPRICDIGDLDRLETVFTEDRPEVVFHAAAHKHVPMMEYNPGEAIKNNVFGTKMVADAAHRHGANAFVMISTDKAVNPTSIMGATKRVAEMYVQALSERSKTKFVAVRFGNVLGSTGSVIPTFKAQIAAGGPVTVTHPDMVRYFMTIPEASQLVMQAASMGKGGEIFVLDMGEPVKIVDLANDLIRLSGLVPGVDIQIEFTGMRPGEKLFEELGFDAEKMSKTTHPKIFVGRLAPSPLSELETALGGLSQYISSTSAQDVRSALRNIVVEMLPDSAESATLPKRRTNSDLEPAARRSILPDLVGSPVR
jgi:FlaA1/EpsC-like NDP-sugar epimerase